MSIEYFFLNAARKDKNSNIFDSNVNRDERKEGKFAKTVVRIKCKYKLGKQHVQEECIYCYLWAQESHWLLNPLPIKEGRIAGHFFSLLSIKERRRKSFQMFTR